MTARFTRNQGITRGHRPSLQPPADGGFLVSFCDESPDLFGRHWPHCMPCRAGRCPSPLLIQPGAPGTPSRQIAAEKATDLSKIQATRADVEFMQGMIHHHLQAIDMTNLLASNTQNDDMRKLGLRMSISQSDEIKFMRHWLELRGQAAPDDHAQHRPDAPLMPGMLSEDEMNRLAAAKGRDFDILFLEGMIKHHGRCARYGGSAVRHRRAPASSRRFSLLQPTSRRISGPRSTA